MGYSTKATLPLTLSLTGMAIGALSFNNFALFAKMWLGRIESLNRASDIAHLEKREEELLEAKTADPPSRIFLANGEGRERGPVLGVIKSADIKRGKLLGRGAYGEVHECRLEGHPGTFAVKRVETDRRHPSVRESLQREMEILCPLRHENIVSLVGYTMDAGSSVELLMEIYGDSLRGVMDKRGDDQQLDWFAGREVCVWLRQIASGLNYLHSHEKPIAHRDIKTENCLVELKGIHSVKNVLLTDFGISKEIEDEGTVEATITGTKGYIAPEMWTGRYDPLKADLYAFGVLAFALLCNLEPKEMETEKRGEVWFALTVGSEAEKRTVQDQHWQWILKHVYQRCAAVDSAQRPTSKEILKDLEEKTQG